jgi:NADH:ubiquinone oxidoreductase subunit 5 (subunit L)/multisubunit Na+/H+ antiporter MnhA subunit
MFIPLALLSIGSIFTGYLTKDLFIGLGSTFFSDSIFILPKNLIAADSEFIPFTIKGLPSVLSLFGIILSMFFYNYLEFFLVFFRYTEMLNKFYKFLVQKWYFDYIQNELIAKPILKLGYHVFFKMVDKGFLEILGPTGITSFVYKLTIHYRKFQTGYIYQYSFIILFFFLLTFIFIELNIFI